MSDEPKCTQAKDSEYVLCDILIEGGSRTSYERKKKALAHMDACALCDAQGKAIVDRLRRAFAPRKPSVPE